VDDYDNSYLLFIIWIRKNYSPNLLRLVFISLFILIGIDMAKFYLDGTSSVFRVIMSIPEHLQGIIVMVSSIYDNILNK
jgi:hypothetical protein